MLPISVARSFSGTLAIGRIAYRREGGDGSAQRGRSLIYDCRCCSGADGARPSRRAGGRRRSVGDAALRRVWVAGAVGRLVQGRSTGQRRRRRPTDAE